MPKYQLEKQNKMKIVRYVPIARTESVEDDTILELCDTLSQEQESGLAFASKANARGSWSDKKQLVLLKKYSDLFPPAARRGTAPQVWEKIAAEVNTAAPNDAPLGIVACKRQVEKLMASFLPLFTEAANSSLTGFQRNRTAMEAAAFTCIQRVTHIKNFCRCKYNSNVFYINRSKTLML